VAKSDELTPREEIFVRELLRGKSKAEAARATGLSPGRAKSNGYNYMSRPRVRKALEEYYEREAEITAVERETMRRELLAMALYDPISVFDQKWSLRSPDEIPEQARKAILSARSWDIPGQGTGGSVRLAPKLDAIKTYLKHFCPPAAERGIVLEEAAQSLGLKLDDLMARLDAEPEEDAEAED